MKPILLLLAALALPTTLFGQGQVIFANDATTLFTTNGGPGRVGLMAGVNAYRIGLYTAPAGTMNESLFTLVALATNNPSLPGRFGDPSSTSVLAGNNGTSIAVQVKAWSTFAGPSYESAAAAYPFLMGQPVYLGKTPIGTLNPTIFPTQPAPLFGVNGVFTSGVVLFGPVPEPSTYALAALGVLMLFCCRKRRTDELR